MLALEVEEEELKKRLLIRGKDSGRADDQNPEIIQNRINEYNNKTMPVKDFYASQNKYKGINGIGEIEGIFALLCNEIEQAI
jgi:adenylate kinase